MSAPHNHCLQSSSHSKRALDEASDTVGAPDTFDTGLPPAAAGELGDPAEDAAPYAPIPWILTRSTPLKLRQRPLWPDAVRDMVQRAAHLWLSAWHQLQMRWQERTFRRRA